MTIIVATAGVDVLCAIAAFLLEHHSQQTEIKTFGSAAFRTTTQLLTVSSQLKNPTSVGGRILDVFMEIYAMWARKDPVGRTTGSLRSSFRRRDGRDDGCSRIRRRSAAGSGR